jgi:subtilisin family serine protease
MGVKSFGALLALVALAAVVAAVPASMGAADESTSTYVVQLVQAPAVTYGGGIAGHAATKPAKGKKLDKQSSRVHGYTAYLDQQHSDVLAEVSDAEKLYDYNIAFNGFAAKLTDAQAKALEKVPGVLSVEADVIYEADTATTPHYLGLDSPHGIWQRLGGVNGKSGAGENIIIGDIDSGITPESLSFTDRKIKPNKLGKVQYGEVDVGPPPDGWAGTCQTGEEWVAADCNNKLIGARYFNAGFGGDAGINANRPWEFNSPRDYNGHGTHTASTAGGNNGVPATGAAAVFGKVSGMAPRARIAAYKALWSTQDSSTASGSGVDLLAAIDAAVGDGVDVINYSISGTSTNFLDGAEIAFLNAADAGVFVSASAGNNGPGASTVAHPSPWITTVAAETHDRVGAGSAVSDGVTYQGASAGTGSASGELVTFGTAGSPQRLCQLNTLPASAAGKVVLCERGVNARIEKSFEVARVGGVGMVLVNPTLNSLNADLHFVPTVHLQNDAYAAVVAAATAGGKTASIDGEILFNQPAPFMAAFSSRGPLTAGAGDLLKPDIGAPGVDVLAAVAPPGNRGREFDLFSGTSMSAPHITGIAALFKQAHPDWSPMAIKSALMTTATDPIEPFTDTPAADATALRAFADGAGHVQPTPALDPGLVFDSDANDWLAFLCGATSGVNPAVCTQLKNAGYSFDRSDMNVPSIAIGDLAGVQTVKRRVTNVDDRTATYTAAGSLTGVDVSVSPSSFSIAPGQTKTIEVSFTRTAAALNKYVGGSLTLAGGGHDVRIPLVVRPVAFGAPTEASSNGSPVSWQVRVGYNGPLNATVGGLVPAVQTAFTVAQDPDQTFVRTDPTGTFKTDVVVAPGAVFRTGIYEDAITPNGTDLDMFVYNGATQVGASADGDSNEEVTLRNGGAAPVTLSVYIHGFSTGSAPSASGTLFTWTVGTVSAGNTTLSGVVSPASVGIQTHTASFSGLAPNTRYLGRVDYNDGTNALGRTLLSVRTP